MPYADPQATHNPTAGQVAPAAWGDVLRDDLEYLARNAPHCRVYNSANISLVTNTVTALTFNSERVDVGGMHSTSSNTGRITVPTGEGGFYKIGGCIQYAAHATGFRSALIRLNGTTVLAQADALSVGGGNVTHVQVFAEYQLAAADYVELLGFQTSGGNLNVVASGNTSPEFWANWSKV